MVWQVPPPFHNRYHRLLWFGEGGCFPSDFHYASPQGFPDRTKVETLEVKASQWCRVSGACVEFCGPLWWTSSRTLELRPLNIHSCWEALFIDESCLSIVLSESGIGRRSLLLCSCCFLGKRHILRTSYVSNIEFFKINVCCLFCGKSFRLGLQTWAIPSY